MRPLNLAAAAAPLAGTTAGPELLQRLLRDGKGAWQAFVLGEDRAAGVGVSEDAHDGLPAALEHLYHTAGRLLLRGARKELRPHPVAVHGCGQILVGNEDIGAFVELHEAEAFGGYGDRPFDRFAF